MPVITCLKSSIQSNKKKPKIIEQRQVTETALAKIRQIIDTTDWQYLNNLDTNEADTEFSTQLTQTLNTEAPIKYITIPANQVSRDPWMTPGLVTSSCELNRLYKNKIGKDKNHTASKKFYIYRDAYNKLKRQTKFLYYNDLLQKYRQDIRKTWQVINSLTGRSNDKSGIADKFKINNISVNDPKIISKEFCDFFTNVGIKYANEIPPSKVPFNTYMKNKSNLNMFLSPTDPYEVCKLINSLKRKHSSGHDNITPSLFKDIKHQVAIPLSLLINKSLNSGIVPDKLKLAKVIPIYKCKDKEQLNNY